MSKVNRFVSIGIPFYNNEDYLTFAIQSVINQSHQDWELILINDGSSDSSLEIAQYFVSIDSRVRVISDGLNKKLPARLNQLIDESKYAYIARMDADDIMHPERLAMQLSILENNPDIDVLGTNAYTIDANNNIIGVRQGISNEVVVVESFVHPSVMAKASWYKKNKYDEAATKSQDTLLWRSTAASSNFKATRQPLMFYREIAGNYYKKYFSSSKAFFKMSFYRANYSSTFLLKKSITALLKGVLYLFFSVLKKEYILINMRNKGQLIKSQINEGEKILQAVTVYQK